MRIYTCIVNAYDTLKPLPSAMRGVCFSDDPDISSHGWEVRPLMYPSGSSRDISWRHKWGSHALFPGEDTLWIDASYLLHDLPPVVECGMFRHYNPRVRSIADEIQYIDLCGRWEGEQDRMLAVAALERYKTEGYTDDLGRHPETGFLVRQDTPAVRRLNEIMLAECCIAGSRDQTVFDYAAWRVGLDWDRLSGTSKDNQYATLYSAGHANIARPRIYYFTPYDKRGLGYAYNQCCQLVPNDAWICLVDADVMLFPSNFGDIIAAAIQRHPEYDVFVTRTTRAGADHARYTIGPEVEQERDLVKIRESILRWQAEHVNEVTPLNTDIIGHVMVFRKSLWNQVPFPSEGDHRASVWTPGKRLSRVLGVDTAWSGMLAGKRVGMIEGLVACHYYRMGMDDGAHKQWIEANTLEGEVSIMPMGDKMIHYFVPYSREGLGKAYNNACRIVPDGDWICLMDADVMLFPSNFGDIVEDAITRDPEVDVWTCMVTRVSCNEKAVCPGGKRDEDRDLHSLKQKAMNQAKEKAGVVSRLEARTLAGYFLLFRKEFWEKHPFPEGGGVLCVDTGWSQGLKATFGLIEGLLAIHYYSLAEERSNHVRFLRNSRKREPEVHQVIRGYKQSAKTAKEVYEERIARKRALTKRPNNGRQTGK